MKFWGVNLTALYPDHATSDALAANLAERQINLARPHHLLRHGKDWNPQMISGALVDYRKDSRTFDRDALDRFDYLNAALRRHGIYLAMSAHMSRLYRGGDAAILDTTPEDAAAWSAAIDEMNRWDWRKSIDPLKSLPVIDERAALLTEEFLKTSSRTKTPTPASPTPRITSGSRSRSSTSPPSNTPSSARTASPPTSRKSSRPNGAPTPPRRASKTRATSTSHGETRP